MPPSVPTLNQDRLADIERDVSREFLIELVGLFVSDVALRLERLSDAVRLRETAKAAAFAHALQGAAASLGVLRLRAVAQRLEELVERDDWGASDATLARLMAEFAQVRTVLSGFGDLPKGTALSSGIAPASVESTASETLPSGDLTEPEASPEPKPGP